MGYLTSRCVKVCSSEVSPLGNLNHSGRQRTNFWVLLKLFYAALYFVSTACSLCMDGNFGSNRKALDSFHKNKTISTDGTSYNLVGGYQCFRITCVHFQCFTLRHSEDEGSTFLQNIGSYAEGCTTSQPRRPQFRARIVHKVSHEERGVFSPTFILPLPLGVCIV
jgi:hypothetical protein